MAEMKTDPKLVKQLIFQAIRTALLQLGTATKAELRESLDISFPTISKFVTQMEQAGEIYAVGFDESSGGRRAKRYAYHPDYMLGLAIVLETRDTHYTVFNWAGDVKKQGSGPTLLCENGWEQLTAYIRNILAEFPSIRSLAIGVPGAVDNGQIIFIPGYEAFTNKHLQKDCEALFSLPTVVENDMNAAVLGYYAQNRMNTAQSVAYVYAGQNGPGAGLIINGQVVRGHSFFSGEIAFVPQYEKENFGQALGAGARKTKLAIKSDKQIDAAARLVASFTAIVNPNTIVFCEDEVTRAALQRIKSASAVYIPEAHLPFLTRSHWKTDYLRGLQRLGRDLLVQAASIPT